MTIISTKSEIKDLIKDNYNSALANYSFIDLFAGIGGFRIALESFGAKCVFTSEWDKYAQETYEMNFNEKPHGDITLIKESEIPKHNILCGGFPCQAFSVSGKKKGFNDARGTLFFDIARIVKYHKPDILFLENVKHLQKHDGKKTITRIISILNDIGYNPYFDVLDSSQFGIPQKRERLYIIALNKKLYGDKKFIFPVPPRIPIQLKEILLSDNLTEKYVIKRNDITYSRRKEEKLLFSDLCLQKPVRIGIVNKGGQGERIYNVHGHAITLSAYGGGVGAKTGLYLVNNKLRKLAPIECARLMGFPDTYKIHPQKSQSYKQFGNSVVIDVLQYIVLELVKQGILK